MVEARIYCSLMVFSMCLMVVCIMGVVTALVSEVLRLYLPSILAMFNKKSVVFVVREVVFDVMVSMVANRSFKNVRAVFLSGMRGSVSASCMSICPSGVSSP